MGNVTPDNLANLQSVAKEYEVSIATNLEKLAVALKEGRGSDMPGIGRA